MDKKEREIQEALGQMKEYSVQIIVPISATIMITKSVMAPSPEDAIENVKTIIEMTPSHITENEVRRALQDRYVQNIRIDDAEYGSADLMEEPMPQVVQYPPSNSTITSWATAFAPCKKVATEKSELPDVKSPGTYTSGYAHQGSVLTKKGSGNT